MNAFEEVAVRRKQIDYYEFCINLQLFLLPKVSKLFSTCKADLLVFSADILLVNIFLFFPEGPLFFKYWKQHIC